MERLGALLRNSARWKGLRIMVLGFLIGFAGVVLSFVSAMLRDAAPVPPVRMLASMALFFGWSVVIAGVAIMLGGIAIHWLRMFGKPE
jgi:hypothetical protein